MHILKYVCHSKGVLIKQNVRISLSGPVSKKIFFTQFSRAPAAEMDKLVFLRDCEEEHLVMFCGAQEQPIPKVFSENNENAEMSRLKRTSEIPGPPFVWNRALDYVIQGQ